MGISSECPGETDMILTNVNGRIFRKRKLDHGNKKPGVSSSSSSSNGVISSFNAYSDEKGFLFYFILFYI